MYPLLPDLDRAQTETLLGRTRAFVEERARKRSSGDAAFLRLLGHEEILLGSCLYATGTSISEVAQPIRSGLADLRRALELEDRSDPWEVWDSFMTGLAVEDRSYTDFHIALPGLGWYDRDCTGLEWLLAQTAVVFALYRRDRREAQLRLADLHAYLFEATLPQPLQPDLPLLQNLHNLLDALLHKKSDSFSLHLGVRLEMLHTNYGASELRHLDLHGLGLCRLARDRSMEIRIKHGYLPLELLEVTSR